MKSLQKLRILLAILAIITTFSCNSSTSDKTKLDTIKLSNTTSKENTEALETTKNVNTLNNNDSVVVDNASYKITTKPNEGEGGELIKVYNKLTKQEFTLNNEDNFVSVDENFLITEGGTAVNYRSFCVYDLNTSKMVFSSNYESGLNIENNILGFKIAVTITDPALKPTCNPSEKIPTDNLGYIEQQYYNLKTKTLKKTGEYECWYFE
jgi:hypothetical protein